jgi:hypothetical protein
MIIGWGMIVQGLLLLAGEYLCVEVAWRCMDYNTEYVGLAVVLLIAGLIMIVIGANDDKTDLAGVGQGPGTQSQRKQS